MEFLKSFNSHNLVLFSGWLATVAAFLITISPYGIKIKNSIHLPYLLFKLSRKKLCSNVLLVSALTENKQVAKQLDKQLYILHGRFKTTNITSNQKDTIGTPVQFDHRTNANLLGIDKELQLRLSGIGDDFQQKAISRLIMLWKPYLSDSADTRILEVILISVYCILSLDVPFNWKKTHLSLSVSIF